MQLLVDTTHDIDILLHTQKHWPLQPPALVELLALLALLCEELLDSSIADWLLDELLELPELALEALLAELLELSLQHFSQISDSISRVVSYADPVRILTPDVVGKQILLRSINRLHPAVFVTSTTTLIHVWSVSELLDEKLLLLDEFRLLLLDEFRLLELLTLELDDWLDELVDELFDELLEELLDELLDELDEL